MSRRLMLKNAAVVDPNLIDKNTLVNGVLNGNGTVGTSPDYRTTQFIVASQGETFDFYRDGGRGTLFRWCAYDANYSFIRTGYKYDATVSFTTPTNTAFIRVCFHKNAVSSATLTRR